MLERCAAVHMASDRDWITRCRAIARQAGFGQSYPYLGVDDIARRIMKTPVQFLFAHYGLEEQVLRDMVRTIRHHHEPDVRFMPLVVFTRNSNAPALGHFLKMGFDDVIAFPCTVPHMVARLALQIEREHDYFQAGDYFGPDRRRILDEDGEQVPDTRPPGRHTRLVVRRDPEHGVRILSREQHVPRQSA